MLRNVFKRTLAHQTKNAFSCQMKDPVRVAITGAAGNIGYATAFRVASGQMLGPDQPVILHLIDLDFAMDAVKGVEMELNDCSFPTLAGIVSTSNQSVGFKDVDYGLLIGAKPRGNSISNNLYQKFNFIDFIYKILLIS